MDWSMLSTYGNSPSSIGISVPLRTNLVKPQDFFALLALKGFQTTGQEWLGSQVLRCLA